VLVVSLETEEDVINNVKCDDLLVLLSTVFLVVFIEDGNSVVLDIVSSLDETEACRHLRFLTALALHRAHSYETVQDRP